MVRNIRKVNMAPLPFPHPIGRDLAMPSLDRISPNSCSFLRFPSADAGDATPIVVEGPTEPRGKKRKAEELSGADQAAQLVAKKLKFSSNDV